MPFDIPPSLDDTPTDHGAPRQPEKANLPRPYLPNDSLKNRLVALTDAKFSIQSLGKASGRAFTKAMVKLGMPVARRWVLPGEKNPHIAAAKQRLAAMPRGTRGLYRKDGAIIIAGQFGNLLKMAIEAKADLSDIYMVRADLEDRYLTDIKMPGGDFRLANMYRVKMAGADISGSDLRRARLDRMRAEAINAEGADFSEARMADARMNKGKLRGAKFCGSILRAAEMNDADLREADFTGAVFKRMSNEYDSFRVEMKGADLRGAKFSVDANFNNINITGAKLEGVVIVDRAGQPIPGAQLMPSGAIIYTEIMPIPGADSTPRLPGR